MSHCKRFICQSRSGGSEEKREIYLSQETCWRVVSSLGRKQISVQIILHNSEFLLPAHVVSGRLSGWACEVFKLNKLGDLKLNTKSVVVHWTELSPKLGTILKVWLWSFTKFYFFVLKSLWGVELSNFLCLFTSSLGCPATPLNIRLVELLVNLIIIIAG